MVLRNCVKSRACIHNEIRRPILGFALAEIGVSKVFTTIRDTNFLSRIIIVIGLQRLFKTFTK